MASWRFDRQVLPIALTSAGAGTGRISNNNAAILWIIVQLSVITEPTSAATCTIRPPIGFVDTAYFAGTGDTASGMYFLFSGDYLELTIASGPANGNAIVTYVFVEVTQ